MKKQLKNSHVAALYSGEVLLKRFPLQVIPLSLGVLVNPKHETSEQDSTGFSARLPNSDGQKCLPCSLPPQDQTIIPTPNIIFNKLAPQHQLNTVPNSYQTIQEHLQVNTTADSCEILQYSLASFLSHQIRID